METKSSRWRFLTSQPCLIRGPCSCAKTHISLLLKLKYFGRGNRPMQWELSSFISLTQQAMLTTAMKERQLQLQIPSRTLFAQSVNPISGGSFHMEMSKINTVHTLVKPMEIDQIQELLAGTQRPELHSNLCRGDLGIAKRERRWGKGRVQQSQKSENYRRVINVNPIRPAVTGDWKLLKLGFGLPTETWDQRPYFS